jgi:hypothetical protein
MDRRYAIRNLLVASGGTLSLPFWIQSCRNENAGGYPDMLRAVVDTILPAGNGQPGALAVGVDVFLEKLINDCYEKPVRDNVRKQLGVLQGQGFIGANPDRRKNLLLKLAGSTDKDEQSFFTLIKTETIRGFSTSQKIMEDYWHYRVAPGHYYGCITVKT